MTEPAVVLLLADCETCGYQYNAVEQRCPWCGSNQRRTSVAYEQAAPIGPIALSGLPGDEAAARK